MTELTAEQVFEGFQYLPEYEEKTLLRRILGSYSEYEIASAISDIYYDGGKYEHDAEKIESICWQLREHVGFDKLFQREVKENEAEKKQRKTRKRK